MLAGDDRPISTSAPPSVGPTLSRLAPWQSRSTKGSATLPTGRAMLRPCTLAGTTEGRELERADSLVEVGIRHDDQMVFRPPAAWTRFAVPRAGLVDMPATASSRRTRRADQGMSQERVDALSVTVYEIEDPSGNPSPSAAHPA